MKERVNISVDQDLLALIDRQAVSEHTSRSALIRRVMRRYVEGESVGGERGAPLGRVAESPATYAPEARHSTSPESLDAMAPLLEVFFAARDDVETAWVFGSLATGRTWRHSDIDIAILPRDPRLASRAVWELKFDLSSRLEQLLGRPVDVTIATEGSTLLRYRVASEGVIVYGDGAAAAETRMRSISEHIEFKRVVAEAATYWAEKVGGYDSV
jgi:predicted nucleotidyltransferase